MRTKLPESKPIDVKSVEWILECAAVLGWNDLLRLSASERVQLAYEAGTEGTLEHLKLWSSAKRGEWDLVCDYWLKTGELHRAGATFRGGYTSAVLERMLDFIMQNQVAFTAVSRTPFGLIQVSKPAPEVLLLAEKTMAAALAECTATLPVADDRKPKRPSQPASRTVPSSIKTGAVMIREGVPLPERAHIETLSYSAGWRSVVNDDCFAIDRKLRAAGWQFFFVAGELRVIEPGWGASTIRRGTSRILARGGKRNLNGMEITQVAAARFLGIPYVSIRAFSYHIQKQPVLQSNAERARAQNYADWACRHSLFDRNACKWEIAGT